MTAPTITRPLPTRADQLAARVESGEALCVTVAGHGPGWWVIGVDPVAGTVLVRRDGVEIPVGWSTIQD